MDPTTYDKYKQQAPKVYPRRKGDRDLGDVPIAARSVCV